MRRLYLNEDGNGTIVSEIQLTGDIRCNMVPGGYDAMPYGYKG
jgi:hypothetical protein